MVFGYEAIGIVIAHIQGYFIGEGVAHTNPKANAAAGINPLQDTSSGTLLRYISNLKIVSVADVSESHYGI